MDIKAGSSSPLSPNRRANWTWFVGPASQYWAKAFLYIGSLAMSTRPQLKFYCFGGFWMLRSLFFARNPPFSVALLLGMSLKTGRRWKRLRLAPVQVNGCGPREGQNANHQHQQHHQRRTWDLWFTAMGGIEPPTNPWSDNQPLSFYLDCRSNQPKINSIHRSMQHSISMFDSCC